jgi:hypothetical protein
LSIKLNTNDPLLWFEKVSDTIFKLKKWYLYPVPLIILYFVTAFVPHLYSIFSDVWWNIHYLNFADTLGWLVLIIAVLYGTAFFRKTLFTRINTLFDDRIIDYDPDDPDDQKQIDKIYTDVKNGVRNKKTIIGFLILFEFLVGFFWYFDIQEGEIVLSQSEFVLQIPGTIIMIFVLPVAAEIFTIALAGALLPLKLGKFAIPQPLHKDHHGGLKPFGDIMLVMEYVYVGGLAISFIAFEEFRSTPVLFGLFIVIMSALILIPQINLHKKLSEAKEDAMAEIQEVYLYKNNHNSKTVKKTSKILPEWKESDGTWPFDASYLTFVKMAKDEVEMMRTHSFDLVTLYKAITLSVLPILSVLIPFVQGYTGFP